MAVALFSLFERFILIFTDEVMCLGLASKSYGKGEGRRGEGGNAERSQ